MAKPTIRQKEAFKRLLEAIMKEEPFTLKEIMKQAGYSEATATHPELNLLSKEGFQQLLNKISDEPLLNRLEKIALKSGPRESINAIKELLKLKGRYPTEETELETGEVKVIIKKKE